MIYLKMLSAPQTVQRQMLGLVNNKLKKMWKEAVVA
jgi:hypothetical protein